MLRRQVVPADVPPATRSANSRSRRLILTGSRAVGAWPPPSIRISSPPVSSDDPLAALERHDLVVAAVDDPQRTCDRSAQCFHSVAVAQPRGRELGRDQRLRGRIQPPCHAVFDLLGGVWLGEDLAPEELQEAAVVLQPRVLVVACPALVAVELLVESILGAVGWGWTQHRHRGADQERPVDPVGMGGGEQQRPQPSHREAGSGRRLEAVRVHHRDRVGHELGAVVGRDLGRPVGESVAAAVEGHHPEVTREVGNLRLPVARVGDRPRGEQQDRRPVLPVGLPVHPHSVSLDRALAVGQPGGSLGVGPPHVVDHRCHGRASNTRLSGVSAAMRTRVKPPAEITS